MDSGVNCEGPRSDSHGRGTSHSHSQRKREGGREGPQGLASAGLVDEGKLMYSQGRTSPSTPGSNKALVARFVMSLERKIARSSSPLGYFMRMYDMFSSTRTPSSVTELWPLPLPDKEIGKRPDRGRRRQQRWYSQLVQRTWVITCIKVLDYLAAGTKRVPTPSSKTQRALLADDWFIVRRLENLFSSWCRSVVGMTECC